MKSGATICSDLEQEPQYWRQFSVITMTPFLSKLTLCSGGIQCILGPIDSLSNSVFNQSSNEKIDISDKDNVTTAANKPE